MAILTLVTSLPRSGTQAQVVVAASAARANPTGGFSVRKEDNAVIEALADFDRYCGKGEWEKAISALSKVIESPAQGLFPADDGFYLPTRVRLRQMLANLPPAGKEAYRLFNDGKAKQQFAQLDDPPDADADEGALASELARLEEMFDLYFVTSIGDQIADRLGDAKFELGDFVGAAACWGAILTDYPDTSLSPLRLHTKRAIALARAGRFDELDATMAQIRQRFSDQTVRIGGRDVVATAMLQEIIDQNRSDDSAERAEGDPVQATASANPSDLPVQDDPLWQCVFADEVYFQKLRGVVNNAGWGGYVTSANSRAPASAVDGQRVYLNWFGVGLAIDAQTGKLLWRTAPFNDLPQKLQSVVSMGISVDNFTIAVAPEAKRLLLVRRALNTPQQAGPAHLACLSTETGEALWNTQSGALSGWAFTGQPLLYGQVIYAAARQGQGSELHLLVIALDDGKLLWKLPLGTSTPGQNFRGMPITPEPILRHAGGMLYVNTNNGAVLAINLAARRIEWAFTFEIPARANREVFYYAPPRQTVIFPAALQVAGSMLFVKDKDHGQLYALELSGPSLKWRRPLDASATVVHADDRFLYVLSEELCCIDITTRDMKWSTKTPVSTGDTRPLVAGGGSRVHLFGSRGVYAVDLTNGERAIFRGYDREGVGSAVWHVGDRMICVSNRAVTAYSLDTAAGPATAPSDDDRTSGTEPTIPPG